MFVCRNGTWGRAGGLHRNHRCKDKWFQGFLKQARDGALEWDMYNFIHGYSTFCPGSWLPPQRHMAGIEKSTVFN